MKLRVAARLAPWTCLLVLIGCSSNNQPECFAVRGQVKFNNKPVGDAMVTFHPQVEPAVPVPRPTAICDAQGNFSLTTFRQNDGAPPGDYAITIELREERMVGEEMVRDGKNVLPAKYASKETSGLNYRVVAGSNEVPTLELTGR